jgi:hypothetical protein
MARSLSKSSRAERTRREELARLVELVQQAEGSLRAGAGEHFSTGCGALDGLLPGGGLARGSLVEWVADAPGGGAGLFAVVAAREAQRDGGAVVVVDRDQGFYPPAAAAWGIDLASMIVVHPRNEADERWAIDQALRCSHVAAVVAWPRRLEGRTFRRWQLAAESSGAVGLFVRPAAARREPSWAQVRWAVTPRPTAPSAEASSGWQLGVRLLRVRGGPVARDAAGERVEVVVEIDPVSGEIHEARIGDLAAELAGAAARSGQA